MTPLALALLLAAAPPASPTVEVARDEQPIALVLSGGVSLGSYEAGLAWTTVRFVRLASVGGVGGRLPIRPKLVAVTGASAGSLNALLAAAMWCERGDDLSNASVDDNLLRNTWLGVGADQLFPVDPDGYLPGDALLSTRPLVESLERLRGKLFGAEARFAAGCRIPLGLTATAVQPEERVVAGLSTLNQRHVLPLALLADGEGKLSLRPEALATGSLSGDALLRLAMPAGSPERYEPDQVMLALLASAAFPAAFKPRELCICASACPESQQVEPGACPGLGPGHLLPQLACATPSPEAKICRKPYVDGGIFDNAPVGLAIDLAEGSLHVPPLRAVQYIFVDPDRRRLRPVDTARVEAPPTGRGILGVADLFGGFISTSRNAELSRAVRSKAWNRTTPGLLREAAAAAATFTALDAQLRALHLGARAAAGEHVPEEEELPRFEIEGAGPALLRCFRQQADMLAHDEAVGACLRQVQSAKAEDRRPLSARELAELAAAMASRINAASRMPPAELVLRSPLLRDRLLLARTGFALLADGILRATAGELSDAELAPFRTNLLVLVRAAPLFARGASVAAHEVADQGLALLAQGRDRTKVERVRAALAAQGPAELFAPRPIQELLAQAPADEGAAPRAGRAVLSELLALRPSLAQASFEADLLAAKAGQLDAPEAIERRLALSSRFAPLAGSHLGAFGAFLDEPLREYDYYAGVYDSLHAIAQAICTLDPSSAGVPISWRPDAPDELDLGSPRTQACLGEKMQGVVRLLDLERSSRARFVIGRLARLELEAALGSASQANALLEGPSWSWTRDGTLQVDPDLAAVTDALTSRRVPCERGSGESVCVGELSFDELLAALHARGYVPREKLMRSLLTSGDERWSPVVRRILDRSMEVEGGEKDGSRFRSTVLLGHGLGELVARRQPEAIFGPMLVVDPSSLPSVAPEGRRPIALLAAHLVPYRVALDVAHGGIAVAWLEPSLEMRPWLSIRSLFEPLDYENSATRASTTIGVMPTLVSHAATLGLGPRFSWRWAGGSGGVLGAEARLGLIQDRAGLSFGVRRFTSSRQDGHEWFVQLSLSDINGTIYWLSGW